MLVSELRQPSTPLADPTPVGQTVLRTHRTRDGVDFDVEASARDVVFEGSPGRLVLARDVTAERQAARALHESESRYRDLFENATAPIATLGLDDRITEVNEAFAHLLGSRSRRDGRDAPQLLSRPRARSGSPNASST